MELAVDRSPRDDLKLAGGNQCRCCSADGGSRADGGVRRWRGDEGRRNGFSSTQ